MDIWKRIEKTETCWNWKGWVNNEGYGVVQRNNRQFMAHRFIYEMIVKKIPKGMVIDHLCRNHACVNPEHLQPVSIKENVLRGFGSPAMNKRKTECKNGHPFTKSNTYLYNGGRFCEKCRYENRKKSYHKLKKLKNV